MTRVALIVTGHLEHAALATALQRLFPSAEFTALGPFADSTSQRLDPAKLAAKVPSKLDELVGHLAASLVRKDRHTPAYDFAVIVEDLELANRGNESTVVQCIRASVQRHIARVPNCATKLGQSASVHLLDPMVEAYFYDDAAALQSCFGVASHQRRAMDPERFEILPGDDPGYFTATEPECAWAAPSRQIHPKKYLSYLLRERPPDGLGTTYKETRQGAAALWQLDWNTVLSPGHSPFLRALVEDLAEALDVIPELDANVWSASPSQAPTSRATKQTAARVLRNL